MPGAMMSVSSRAMYGLSADLIKKVKHRNRLRQLWGSTFGIFFGAFKKYLRHPPANGFRSSIAIAIQINRKGPINSPTPLPLPVGGGIK